jgi:RimJ/RimL family protein N-acetyltransferase
LLETGDGVGIGRFNVHYVITEYGIAYLFGKSIRERALAMIEVAHPDHRETLLEAAKKLNYVAAEQFLASRNAYPVQEERRLTLANGAEVLIRPAHAADADALRALFHRLSPDDVYTRFFRKMRSLSYQDLQTLCNVNHETQVAFLAVTGPREHEVVVASGCYFLNPTTNLAEVAFMVAPEWQGQGLGTALQTRLQEYAMARNVRGFIAEILASNERMVRLAAKASGVATTTQEDQTVQVTTLFSDRPRSKPASEGKPSQPTADTGEKPAKKTAAKRKSRRSTAK